MLVMLVICMQIRPDAGMLPSKTTWLYVRMRTIYGYIAQC